MAWAILTLGSRAPLALADDEPRVDRERLEAIADSLDQTAAITLFESLDIEVDYDEGEDVLEGKREIVTRVWLRSESAVEMYRVVSFIELPSFRLDDLEIRVRSPDDSEEKYDEGDLDWVSRIPVSKRVYYVDGEEKFAMIPGLQVGDILTTRMRFEIDDSHGIPPVHLGGEGILRSSLRVRLDDDLTLSHRVQGTDRARSHLQRETVDDRTTRWQFVPPVSSEEEDRKVTITLHGTHPEGGMAAGPDWVAAGDAFLDLAEARLQPNDEIRARVRSTLRDAGSTASERIDALYQEVQAACRYLGLFSERGGVIPDPAAQVIEQGHSDCKGLGGLLIAMLRAADIEAHPILLRTAGGEPIVPELPNMAQFDHFIVWADDGSEEGMWLDATADQRPAGMLPWMDCVDAAVLVERGRSRVVSLPRHLWQPGLRELTIDGTLDHLREMDLVIEEHCEGEPAVRRRYFAQRLPASAQDEVFSDLLQPASHRMRIQTELDSSGEVGSCRLRAEARSVSPLIESRGRIFLPAQLVPLQFPDDDSVRESVERGLLPFADLNEQWSIALPEGVVLGAADSLEVDAGLVRCAARSWQEGDVLRLERSMVWDETAVGEFDEEIWSDARRRIDGALSGHLLLETEGR